MDQVNKVEGYILAKAIQRLRPIFFNKKANNRFANYCEIEFILNFIYIVIRIGLLKYLVQPNNFVSS